VTTETSSYLPAEIANLNPDELSQGYWDACSRRELAIQHCAACDNFQHPPKPLCAKCRTIDLEFAPTSGRGKVFTFIVVHHPVHPALQPNLPYNVALVTLDDAPGVRLVTNIVDTPPEEIQIGMAVEVAWEEPNPGVVLPRFRRR
jgi:uncharacterized OB-fold protein